MIHILILLYWNSQGRIKDLFKEMTGTSLRTMFGYDKLDCNFNLTNTTWFLSCWINEKVVFFHSQHQYSKIYSRVILAVTTRTYWLQLLIEWMPLDLSDFTFRWTFCYLLDFWSFSLLAFWPPKMNIGSDMYI